MNRHAIAGTTAAVLIIALIVFGGLAAYELGIFTPASTTQPGNTQTGTVQAYTWTPTISGIFALNGTAYAPAALTSTFYHSGGVHLSAASSLYNIGGGTAITTTAYTISGTDGGFVYCAINPGTAAFLDVPALMKNPGFANGYWIPVGVASAWQFVFELTPTTYVGAQPSQNIGAFPVLGAATVFLPLIHNAGAVAAITAPSNQTSTSGKTVSLKWYINGIVIADGITVAGIRIVSNQTTNDLSLQSLQVGGQILPVYNAPPGSTANANGFYSGGQWTSFAPYSFSSGGIPQGFTVMSDVNQFGNGVLFGASQSSQELDLTLTVSVSGSPGPDTLYLYVDLISSANAITTLSAQCQVA